MSYMQKKDEGDGAVVRVDRTAVFQEARAFNQSPISPRKCRIILTKIALLLFSGEKFPTTEATDLFFGISKLFQAKDASLRQMLYLVMKELASSAEDTIMVTSSIMKDTSVNEIYRANSIRALCRIIDASTAQAIERLLKTAIVDKVQSVSSAALVTSYHLLPIARDVVRRMGNEVQEAATAKSSGGIFGFGGSAAQAQPSSTNNSQYHAIGLLYQLRSHDKGALVKMVQSYSAAGVLKSNAATMLLVRLAAKLAEEDVGLRQPMVRLLDGWLRHKSELVNFEAARAIADLREGVPQEVIVSTIHVLSLFLTSPRPVTRFAAIRILHDIASYQPDAVRTANSDIENLISNSNRSIASFAITTLLKTGNENSVDRLVKQISSFMSEIPDSFKVTIVEAIRTLCLKFPSKQAAMLSFLSGLLRDEGGFDFKRAVVEAMFDLIRFVPQAKEDALQHLAEFIEDSEFTKLTIRILYLLGEEGPNMSKPSKYIRYIYNRVVLENAVVRAAAVTALGKFGISKDQEIRASVKVLLTRCLDDVDDEVRDRAALNLRLMEEDDETAQRFIRNDSLFSLPILEHQLVMYVTAEGRDTFASPFDLAQVPIVTREQAHAEEKTKKLTSATPTLKAPGATKQSTPSSAEAASTAAAAAQQYAQQLQAIPELAAFGSVLKSSAIIELTESETEYVVKAIKHIFKEHIVLQFDVRNTLPDTVLTDVSIVSTPSEDDEEPGLEEDFIIPVPKIASEETATIYVSFTKTGGEAAFAATSFTNILKFTSKEIDPSTGEPEESGYEDEYQVEDLDLSGADYVVPAYAGSFDNVWEKANGQEAAETLQLGNIKSISDAVEQFSKTLSMQPLEGTDVALSTTTHTLKLYGKSITGGTVAAMVRMAYSAKSGVTVQIKCRSEEDGLAPLVVASVS